MNDHVLGGDRRSDTSMEDKLQRLNQLVEKQRQREEFSKRMERELNELGELGRRGGGTCAVNGGSQHEHPPVQTTVKVWTVDTDGSIVNFSLTEARRDLIFRLETGQLYTANEVRNLIGEIVKKMKEDAEVDIGQLMTLNRLRADLLFPQPLPTVNLNSEHTFRKCFTSDSHEMIQLLRGNGRQLVEGNTAEKLQHLMTHLNVSLVHMIDDALRQRMNRQLLCATILKDLETKQHKI